MTKVLAVIPARGGSKGIVNKNIIPINGKPLIAYTIEAALSASTIDEVMVSTDSEKIALVAEQYQARVPFMRPKQLASDDSSAFDALQHVVCMYESYQTNFDLFVYLQPTSPLRSADDIDAAVKLISNTKADSLVSVMDVPHQFGIQSLMQESDGYVQAIETGPLRRQDKAVYVARNGPAILITKMQTLQKYRNLYGENVLSYKMPANRSVDIDGMSDVDYVQWLLMNRDGVQKV